MAAGKGSRLMPLTKDKPKCMVEVKDKPIIQHLIDNIDKSGIELVNLIIINGYKGNKIIDYFSKNIINSDKYKSITSVEFVQQHKLDGTAGAISLVENIITSDTFLVLSGDVIYTPEEILALSKDKNSLLYTTMINKLYEYGTLDIKHYSGIPNSIRYINEKSSRPTSNHVNCGAYHFDKNVFKYINKTPIDSRFDERIITNTINLMIDNDIQFSGKHIKNLNQISYVDDIKEVEERL